MSSFRTLLGAVATTVTLLTAPHVLAAENEAPAAADPSLASEDRDSRPRWFHADAEVDPTAYVLSGYSLHVGIGYRHVRLDLGAFAMDLPSFVHGNEGFQSSFNGYGMKLHVFPFAEQQGPFVGVDGGTARMEATWEATGETRQQRQFSAGVHAGWRIGLPAGFYATPWIGVSYAFGAGDITIRGATYKASPVSVFPAIHLGYRFM